MEELRLGVLAKYLGVKGVFTVGVAVTVRRSVCIAVHTNVTTALTMAVSRTRSSIQLLLDSRSGLSRSVILFIVFLDKTASGIRLAPSSRPGDQCGRETHAPRAGLLARDLVMREPLTLFIGVFCFLARGDAAKSSSDKPGTSASAPSSSSSTSFFVTFPRGFFAELGAARLRADPALAPEPGAPSPPLSIKLYVLANIPLM